MAENKNNACPVNHPHCDLITAVAKLREHNSQLSAQVRTDHLTGLYNHRHFMETLEAEIERTARSGQPVALILLDLDHFKQVNDQWGHEVGNQALRLTADLMAGAMRRVDAVCRYGGEEFAIISPGTTLTGAIQAAERLRRTIESTPLPVEEQSLTLTASLGLTVHERYRSATPEQLIAEADGFLYEAKRTGRNRLCHPQPAETVQVSADERALLFS